MANKNTKRRVEAAHDAFARIKHQRGSVADDVLARTVGRKEPLDKNPKVGRSAREIMRRLGTCV